MDVTGCPEPGCDLPAEILDRRILESTGGPIEHAWITCLGGHRFFMPIEMLPARADLCRMRSPRANSAMRPGARKSR